MDFKEIKKANLHIEEYIFLYMLYKEEDWNEYPWLLDKISLQQMIHNLEQQLWIINGESGYMLRNKGLELFDSKDEAKEIIEYLNKCTGKNFKNVKSNKTVILARLSEGYTVDEIKKMIETMTSKWQNTKMQIYLRPETLFNATKFQTYINEIAVDTTWTNERV